MIKAGETGIRINACCEKDEDENAEHVGLDSRKKRWRKSDSPFRRVSTFDISQTRDMDSPGEDGGRVPLPAVRPAGNILEVVRLEGSVAGYETLLDDLAQVSPLPIVFRNDIKADGSLLFDGVIIKKGMSQLHTVRTIVNQIAQVWLRPGRPDREQLAIMAESVAFIVRRSIGLDTSDFSFQHIAAYSLGRERNALEKFLDVIQKTALYFIDTLDGIRAARLTGYQTDELFLFTNKKTAYRLFRQGYYLYLVYPGQGELLAMNQKQIKGHEGPYAAERAIWFNTGRLFAA
jgi:hypothetical protein